MKVLQKRKDVEQWVGKGLFGAGHCAFIWSKTDYVAGNAFRCESSFFWGELSCRKGRVVLQLRSGVSDCKCDDTFDYEEPWNLSVFEAEKGMWYHVHHCHPFNS